MGRVEPVPGAVPVKETNEEVDGVLSEEAVEETTGEKEGEDPGVDEAQGEEDCDSLTVSVVRDEAEKDPVPVMDALEAPEADTRAVPVALAFTEAVILVLPLTDAEPPALALTEFEEETEGERDARALCEEEGGAVAKELEEGQAETETDNDLVPDALLQALPEADTAFDRVCRAEVETVMRADIVGVRALV